MSIMDAFRNLGNAQQQQQQQQQPVHTTQSNPATAPAQPGQQAAPASFTAPEGTAPAAEVSPLDAFKDLWKNEPTKEGTDFNPSDIFQLDPAKIQAALQQVDFTKSITQDELSAITAGGEGAVTALAAVLNKASRETMGAATSATAKMIEAAMTRAQGSIDGRISSQVKLSQVSSSMQEQNPAINHPAVQPVVELMKQQFTQKYPTASAPEIAKMAADYVGKMAQVFAGKAEPETSGKSDEPDWNAYFFNN